MLRSRGGLRLKLFLRDTSPAGIVRTHQGIVERYAKSRAIKVSDIAFEWLEESGGATTHPGAGSRTVPQLPSTSPAGTRSKSPANTRSRRPVRHPRTESRTSGDGVPR